MKKHSFYKNLFFTFIISLNIFNAQSQCLSAWKYYLPITVANNTFANLSDYQVKVTVNTATPIAAGKMISTGDDIRFIDGASCNNLNYWIESGMNSANTVIWIKLPTLPATANRVINMYYGNVLAPTASNGDSTFLIFDDFLGTSLNTAKWQTVITGTGSVNVSGGNLVCTTTAEANIRSKASFASPIVLEANMAYISGSWESLAILNNNTKDGYGEWMGNVLTSGSNTMYFGLTFTPANPACDNYTAHTYNTYSNPGTLTGLWQVSWPSSNVQSASWPGGSYSYSYQSATLASTVQVAVGQMCGANGSMSVDWIRARNYAAAEATTTNGVERNNHTSGIDHQVQLSGINIYPNPAHDIINIDMKGSLENYESLQMIDMNGRTVQSLSISGRRDNIELPLSNLEKGSYLIRLVGKSGTLVQKISVE